MNDAHTLAARVRSGDVTALELTEATLASIVAKQGELNAFTGITAERARKEAAAVDAARAAGLPLGPLAGVPFAVKNLFDLAGVTTLAGAGLRRAAPPADTDAEAVARLKAAGAVCVGALNMGEFAYDFVTENAHFGATRNPRDLGRSAGGSSGGSAAVVAAGLVPIALGTDTNGSIRVPSAFCGVWGLRPTPGRVPLAGVFPFVESLDQVGPLAGTAADLGLVYDVLRGQTPALTDPVSAEPGIEGLRIGVLGGYFASGGDPMVHAAVAHVANALGGGERVELPAVAEARAAAYLLTAAEAGRLHLDRLRSRAEEFEPLTRDRLLAGLLQPAAWVDQARRFRAWWPGALAPVFARYDVLLAPAVPVPATRLGQATMELGGREVAVRPNLGYFTQPLSLAGLPVVAAPLWMQGAALPTAVQLVAAPGGEAAILRVARHLERLGVCGATPPRPGICC